MRQTTERVMEIAKYNLTRAEAETTIRWDAEEKIAHIYTADPISTRKLDKLCAERPDTYKLVKRDENGAWYEAPAKMIKFGKPPSEARREACRRNSPFVVKTITNTSK